MPAILKYRLFVDIGLESGLGVSVRVAHVVPTHTGFQANLTSHVWLQPISLGYLADAQPQVNLRFH